MIHSVKRQVVLWRKRRELLRVEEFIQDLHDQVVSGQVLLAQWERRRKQVEGQLLALEPASKLIEESS
jgi:hypothetical protein